MKRLAVGLLLTLPGGALLEHVRAVGAHVADPDRPVLAPAHATRSAR